MSLISAYAGTKYYDQGPRYEAQTKNLLRKSTLKKRTILSAEGITFFSKPIENGFDPYRADRHNPVHRQLKKLAADFETHSRGRSLQEKINMAHELVSEIHIADGLHRKKPSTLQEMHTSAQALLDAPPMSLEQLDDYLKENDGIPGEERSDDDITRVEMGVRFYLACSLFKTQSTSLNTKTQDIAGIYNFMTRNNTFKPYWGALRLAMHPHLLGRIGSNIADRLTVTPSIDATLAQANRLVTFYANKMKSGIEKGETEEVIFIDGVQKDGPTVQNKSINALVKSSEIMYRHMLARKMITSLVATYKPHYQKTGELPKDLERTIGKITAFLHLPSEPAAIRRALASPCDPAKELLEGIFGTPQDTRALLEKVEREAALQHEKATSWTRFLPFTRTLSHTEIDRIKERKIQAIQRASRML